jgi:hypothetical protein
MDSFGAARSERWSVVRGCLRFDGSSYGGDGAGNSGVPEAERPIA